MFVTILGTGVLIPEQNRAQAGILVESEDTLVLFDCGNGVLKRIIQAGYDHEDIQHVFISHIHIDHTSDIPPLLGANFLKGKLDFKLYGPKGTKDWLTKILEAYDYIERINFQVNEIKDEELIELGDLRIRCRYVSHGVPSLGFRIECDSSMVYSGDTETCNGMRDLCSKKTDLLIHECSFLDDFPRRYGHTTPSALSEFLKNLNVSSLIVTHIYPESRHEELIIKAIRKNYQNELMIGEDLLRVEI
ncbi:MAG: MBL fold metallo-hydrolase [Candidatus Hydrothermarchaeota archaeon]